MIFEFENGSMIADTLLYYTLMRGRYDYSIEFLNLLSGLEKDDLMNAIRNYMPENYFITIAGK
jgi:predicted Zn-dependent peptidase